MEGFDDIIKPKHYADGDIEVIDFIDDRGLIDGFCKGNAIKYIARAGRKSGGEEEDLRKALWYLAYRICRLRGDSRWIARLKNEEIAAVLDRCHAPNEDVLEALRRTDPDYRRRIEEGRANV